jgi:xyloglucan-specific exo-beta-1,4-glucanase
MDSSPELRRQIQALVDSMFGVRFRARWNSLQFLYGLLFVFFATVAARADQTAPPRSEPYVWQNVAIVAGGFMPGIEFSPAARGLAYIRADIGGAYRWDLGRKSWEPLTDWAGIGQWNDLGIESLAVDPSDANRVYIAAGTYTNESSGNGTMLRSGDQGRRWHGTAMPFKMGGNEDGRSMGERLAVDPHDGRVLFFGSRHNGLWRSADRGETWSEVKSFPIHGNAKSVGIGFVVFDARSGVAGSTTPTIYAGVAEGKIPIYRSVDGGKTWAGLKGEPTGLMPQHAVISGDGMMYVSYTNLPGPNGVTDGAVYRLNTADDSWMDITPEKATGVGDSKFGYSGLSVDARHPGTVMVATMDHWIPCDDIFRSLDGGKNWKSVRDHSAMDIGLSPYLKWGNPEPKLGWWLGSVEIDPFDSNHVIYVTGATVYGCSDISEMDAGRTVHWSVAAKGIEETAVIDLVSPPVGPHLISALGDVCGFRHDDFSVSPPGGMMSNPIFYTTTGIDESVSDPYLMVRTGSSATAHGAYSTDIGATWKPFATEPKSAEAGSIAISADGATLVWAADHAAAAYSNDTGVHWSSCRGLGEHVFVVSDPGASNRFYAVDQQGGNFYVSENRGVSFGVEARGLPRLVSRMRVLPANGEIFFPAEDGGMLVSTDHGATFAKMSAVEQGNAIGFGAPPPGRTEPAIYLAGIVDGVSGVFRSDDGAANWIRINDDAHQYGWPHSVSGDPRIYGRVYLGTNGRGILYADPVAAAVK